MLALHGARGRSRTSTGWDIALLLLLYVGLPLLVLVTLVFGVVMLVRRNRR